MRSNHSRRRATWGTASLLAMLAAAPAAIAAPAEPVLSFAIAGGTLESVLTAYAARASVQILYTPEVVRGRRSGGLSGDFTAKAALERLIAGTGIVAQQSRPGVIVLRIGVVAGAEQTIASEVAQAPPSILDEVIVTGSHIRGVGAGPSPIVSFDRDEIDRQGYATVADALTALPQNFSGVATPDVVSTAADTSSQNNGRATTINLRGLGPDATLVLINGRRMAGSGGKGDLADVSAIPTAAVARIDVLLDGASALYGADAVGGVVNIVLRRDFDGAETRARYGVADGGAEEVQFAQTLGATWASGRVLASYEYYDRAALPFAARPYTASADLRPFGGTDRRAFNASPGNILLANPATGVLVPTWAIPAGATTFPLRPGDFQFGVVNRDSPREGMDLLPHQRRHSIYAALGQSLGERIEASADLRFSRRISYSASLAPTATVVIADNNPFFASPNGSRSHQIAYSFIDALGNSQAFSTSESLGVSLGAEVRLWGDWRLDAYGAHAREDIRSGTNGNLHALFLREAVGSTADNPATSFRAAVDGYFNPYGPSSRAVLDFIGAGYGRQHFESQVTSFNLQADGKLWTLPGGDLRLAVGAHGRREAFEQATESFAAAATPIFTAPPANRREVLAGFAELRAPLVGPENAVPGVRRLELSLAARIERYDDVGTTTNPKIGLTWEPAEGLRVRGTYGTSFRAPVLSEIYLTPATTAIFFTQGGGRVLALNLTGGNRDLEPETATSWTVGLDYSPAALPGLKLGATLFDTDFENQIDRPVSRFIQTGIGHPAIAPFVRFVDPRSPADLALVQSLLDSPAYATPGLHPATAFGVIVDARYVNTGRVHVRGVDLSGSYGFDRGRDRFDVSANASYLIDYALQVTPTAPTTNYVGIAGQPVDLRARVAFAWRREALGATLGLNYVDAYRSEAGARIDAWTTADLQLRWTPESPPLEGLSVAVSVQNLFDTDPPFYDAATGVGYDATNAEPLGRYAAIQLTKRW
ncbi:TonB-dependent receptor [Phenylobacterium sp.]|uniref:TonB-dependent receptor n=1 Tax=Phenylobacterium sp. TaxID=1871053 RepID=UPI002FCC8E95